MNRRDFIKLTAVAAISPFLPFNSAGGSFCYDVVCIDENLVNRNKYPKTYIENEVLLFERGMKESARHKGREIVRFERKNFGTVECFDFKGRPYRAIAIGTKGFYK